jgi:hypothetical protein
VTAILQKEEIFQFLVPVLAAMTPHTKRLAKSSRTRSSKPLALLISANIFLRRYTRRKSAWASVVVSESLRLTERSALLALYATESKMTLLTRRRRPVYSLRRKLWLSSTSEKLK